MRTRYQVPGNQKNFILNALLTAHGHLKILATIFHIIDIFMNMAADLVVPNLLDVKAYFT